MYSQQIQVYWRIRSLCSKWRFPSFFFFPPLISLLLPPPQLKPFSFLLPECIFQHLEGTWQPSQNGLISPQGLMQARLHGPGVQVLPRVQLSCCCQQGTGTPKSQDLVSGRFSPEHLAGGCVLPLSEEGGRSLRVLFLAFLHLTQLSQGPNPVVLPHPAIPLCHTFSESPSWQRMPISTACSQRQSQYWVWRRGQPHPGTQRL